MSCEAYFLQKLRENGCRLTPQRELVLSVLHEIEDLATVEEIHERVHAVSAAVDISTVYRTLDLLHSFELVAVVDPGDGQRRYELLGLHGPHIHLICRECGQVIGTELAPLSPWIEQLQRQHGFALDTKHLNLTGLCRDCQAKKQDRSEQSTAPSDLDHKH